MPQNKRKLEIGCNFSIDSLFLKYFVNQCRCFVKSLFVCLYIRSHFYYENLALSTFFYPAGMAVSLNSVLPPSLKHSSKFFLSIVLSIIILLQGNPFLLI